MSDEKLLPVESLLIPLQPSIRKIVISGRNKSEHKAIGACRNYQGAHRKVQQGERKSPTGAL